MKRQHETPDVRPLRIGLETGPQGRRKETARKKGDGDVTANETAVSKPSMHDRNDEPARLELRALTPRTCHPSALLH
jgi:hypothetical protein